jgi:hypothetical protein
MIEDVAKRRECRGADAAQNRWVVLPRTCDPHACIQNVHFARGVYEVQGERRHGWDGVLSVVDVRDRQHLACVHVVRERGVADSRHAVADHAQARDSRQVQRQVHCVEQRKRGAERMPNHGYGGGTVLFEQLVHSHEDRFCCAELSQLGVVCVCGVRSGDLHCMLCCESAVHLDQGGEAGEERRVQVGHEQRAVRHVRRARWFGSVSHVCVRGFILHSQLCGVRSLVGNDDRAQGGIPPNVPCAVFSTTIDCDCGEYHKQN